MLHQDLQIEFVHTNAMQKQTALLPQGNISPHPLARTVLSCGEDVTRTL